MKKIKTDNPYAETYSVPKAAQKLNISKNACYDAVKRGELPSLKIGKRVLVPKAALDRLLSA